MSSVKKTVRLLSGILVVLSFVFALTACNSGDPVCNHSGGVATCTDKAVCDDCGNAYGDLNPSNHASSEFTYTVNSSDGTKHDKKHACCNTLVETALHTWDGGTETVPPTETEDGLMEYTCELCGANKEEGIPSLSHTHAPTYVAASESSCTSDGNIEYWYCEGCDKCFADEECLNMILREATVISASHSIVITSTSATCTEPAKTTYACSKCVYSTTVVTAPALGHTVTFRNVKSVTKVSGETCEYTVVYSGACGICGIENVEDSVTETRHTYVASIKNEATCQADGKKVYTCVHGCQDSAYEAIYTDENAHKWVADGDVVGNAQGYKCDNSGCLAHKSVVVLNDGKINKAEIGTNELKVGDVALVLDSSVLDNLSDGEVIIGAETLLGEAKTAVLDKLSEDERAALDGKKIYDFTLKQGEDFVTDFGGGKIRITVPYTLSPGEDPDCIVVWFIADNGDITVEAAAYSCGYVTFEVTHFSAYVPTSVSTEDVCLVNGHNYVELEGGSVAPTCDSIGFTTKICTRCSDTYIADVLQPLGHKFTAEPDKVAAGCNTYGKYTYTCQVAGCGYEQEIPIKPVHDYRFHDSKTATCCEDGYRKEKCSICGDIKTTVYEMNPDMHDMSTAYRLVDGGTSCSDGVEEYRRCKVSGCGYEEITRTFNSHDEVKRYDDAGNYFQPEEVVIDLKEYVDLSMLGVNPDSQFKLVARKAACVCGQVYSTVDFYNEIGDGGGAMFDSWFDDTYQVEISNHMPPQYGGFSIIILFRAVVDGNGDSPCHERKTLEVLVNYDAATDTADEVFSFLLADGYNHKNTYNIYYLDEGSEICKDGLICTLNCRDCGTEIDRWSDSVYNADHRYNDVYPTYDLSRYSASGHKTYIIEKRCPCGTSKLEVKTGNTSTTKCVFTREQVTRNDGAVVTTYKCACGIEYQEVVRKNMPIGTCTYRTSQIIYYNYDEENEVYLSNTVSTYIDSYSHSHKGHKEYTYENGCYVEYIETLKCSCGHVYPNYEQHRIRYEHELTTVVTYDSMHNATHISNCESCDYVSVSVYDENGYLIHFDEEIYNPKTGIKSKETSTYRFINGEEKLILHKTEKFDIDTGDFISWEQTAFIYTYGTANGCFELKYTTDSEGNFDVLESRICNSNEYIHVESTCTQFGVEGYKCTFCGRGETYELYPGGHFWMSFDEHSCICDRCGETADSSKNTSVVLEILARGESVVEIGYLNYYAGFGVGRIDGIVKFTVTAGGNTYEMDVDYVDDGKSVITVSVADVYDAISELNLSSGTSFKVRFTVFVETYGETVETLLLSGVIE